MWKQVKFSLIFKIDYLSSSNETACKWIPQGSINDRLTSVQVMAWCCQKTRHYLNPFHLDPWHHMRSVDHNELTHWGESIWGWKKPSSWLSRWFIPHVWWCHGMETFSGLLALYERNHQSPVDSPHKCPVMWTFDVFFVVSLSCQWHHDGHMMSL